MPKRTRPYEMIFNILTSQAKRRGIPVQLSYEEFVEFTSIVECVYCKTPVSWLKHHTKGCEKRTNLDRKNNTLGYSRENCVVCCYRCNSLKLNQLTYEQMLEIGKLLAKWDGR